ncbi:long-chain-fatty-acid--CoA ligase [Carboxydothermus hydrogenoformans]|uniref:Long-chain-fatty-acid--CoA ligase n=1 Tax=Carboxydothermus hydrogenoformans (strain ATCC BAA-161 / DSM 6008 / Z-2901) TaxID=246194 RepID=Q3ABD3_CARHZ|nr:long-chain fatty acid--CoA ligase [Carboxydothermus hydrogenoformans]ABB15077.1 long-chain-fatty-acid--CoA ligase [Carboxydothermus hydrogenoformans Z-2901]
MSSVYQAKPWLKHYSEGVRASLNYPEKTLHELFWETTEKYPGLIATVFLGQEMTYKELGEKIKRFTNALSKLGIKKGDRVAVMLPNCPEFVISYFAILTLGGIVVQTNPMYVERELEYQLNDSGAETIILLDVLYPRANAVKGNTALKNLIVVNIPLIGTYPGEFGPGVYKFNDLISDSEPNPPEVTVTPDDVAVLQYTGGTTGISKGAMLTHKNLVANVYQVREFSNGIFFDGQERILTALPLFHVYGMTCCMNLATCFGGTMILIPKFDATLLLQHIQRYRPTSFPGAPTMYVALLNHPDLTKYDLRSINVCVSGSAPLPVEVQTKFEEVTGAVVVEGYGLSEASPVTHCNPIRGTRKIGSIGVPYSDTIAKIVDIETGEELPPGQIGELVVKGPQVMKGYWNRPEETANALKDGWLYTGDLAKMDEDGFFYIVDRKKDMIIAGGYNIYPREVEEVLYQHPKVKEAIVVGVPDPYRGETVKAFIVVKEGETLTEQEVIEFCNAHLARYKVPRLVEFRSELPKTAVGKVLRRQLREEELKKQQKN